MAWKLRKDKLKAGAPEAEAPAPPVSASPDETEHAPVFDLSGSAFQSEAHAAPEEEPEVPSFLDSEPVLSPAGDTAHMEVPTLPRLAPKPSMDELEPLPVELEPLPTHYAADEPALEPGFLSDPLPEFDPVVARPPYIEPEEIAVAPVTLSPETEDTEPTPLPTFEEAPHRISHADFEREAIASGLVSLETETGLPKVAPFILDTPVAPTVEAPRMHNVVIRIGKLSATHFLTKDVTTIGRPDSVTQNYPDIEIELDDGISRRHAEMRRVGSEYTIVDVGSTNGTLLNGEQLTPNDPVTLQTGDRIRVGERTELQFE